MAEREVRAKGLQGRIERAIGSLYDWLERNRVTRMPWAVIQTYSQAQGSLLSGSMAYYTFLSLLPLILVAAFVLGTVSRGNDAFQEVLAQGVEAVFPTLRGETLLDQLIRSRVAFGVVGLITVAYAGSGFVGALTASLNRMWTEPVGRHPLWQKVVNLVIVLLFGGVLLGSVGVTVWVRGLAEAAFGNDAGPVANFLELIAAPVAVLLVILIMYRLLPSGRHTWRQNIVGAVVVAVGFEVLKRGFAFWATRSAGVAALPRSLVSVVLLLLWLGFFSQLILYGAALNVVRERKRRGVSLMPPSAGQVVRLDG